jgi:hypothetical protein
MSNNGVFYLDAASRPAAKMWLNITALGGATPAQAELLLGGETSMWQDQYVHSCLFANSQDANFSESVSGCVWPRAAIAAGSFWGFYSATKGLDQATFDATHRRLAERGIPSCPCASLNGSGCSQMGRCGESYCPPPPPSPPPPPTPPPASCGSAPPYTCLFAVPCDAADPDQSLAFDASTGLLRSASGLCADAVGCKQVSVLAPVACEAGSATQQWAHSADGRFRSAGCKGQCIDCYSGGRGDAGLYNCDGASNQVWVAAGKTFSENYSGLKCMSQGPGK